VPVLLQWMGRTLTTMPEYGKEVAQRDRRIEAQAVSHGTQAGRRALALDSRVWG
jgi:hypothetical protein